MQLHQSYQNFRFFEYFLADLSQNQAYSRNHLIINEVNTPREYQDKGEDSFQVLNPDHSMSGYAL